MFEFNDPAARQQGGNKIEIGVKKKQQIEYLPFGKISVQRGHTLFEIDTQSGGIREAQYKVTAATYDLSKGISTQVAGTLIINNGCVYIPALNRTNALKKYNHQPLQSHYFAKDAPMQLGELRPSIRKPKRK